MSSSEGTLRILEHLARGGTVKNQYGTTIGLDEHGGQVVLSRRNKNRRGRSYGFSSPEFWELIPIDTTG